MTDALRTGPSKTRQIGHKQLSALANLPWGERLDHLAKGLPLLVSSAESLLKAREVMETGTRASQILRGQAQEEAAKALILIDYVRCPPALKDLSQRQLGVVYDHCSRLIYARSCNWRPVDVKMLRTYVDQQRGSHYVEGEYGEYILPNWELYMREARLYADLTRTDDGNLVWNDPDAWSYDFDLFDYTPTVFNTARALWRVGAFTRQGLEVVHEVWGATAFQSSEDQALSSGLIEETLKSLLSLGLPLEGANQDDATAVFRGWQLPMYAIDTRPRPIDLETLRAEQEAHLAAELR